MQLYFLTIALLYRTVVVVILGRGITLSDVKEKGYFAITFNAHLLIIMTCHALHSSIRQSMGNMSVATLESTTSGSSTGTVTGLDVTDDVNGRDSLRSSTTSRQTRCVKSDRCMIANTNDVTVFVCFGLRQ